MKRILLLILMLPTFSGRAQFSENFNATTAQDFPPPGWLVTDNGIGNQMWQSNLSSVFELSNPCAYMNRQNISVGNTSEDWLITPAITVGQGQNLFFKTRMTLAGDQSSKLKIMASTVSQSDLSSFQPIGFFSESEIGGTFDEFETLAVSLQAFEGQQIYIAFVRVLTQPTMALTGDRWLIDDVNVGEFAISPGFYAIGHVSADITGTCDPGLPMKFTKLIATTNLETKNVYTDYFGNYEFYILGDNLTITPEAASGNIFNVSPTNQSFTLQDDSSAVTANFCFQPNENASDVRISFTPIDGARPGFDIQYRLVFKNKYYTSTSGTIQLTFEDPILDFVNSSVSPESQQNGILTWNYNDLGAMESREIIVTFNLNSPMETPAVNIGDELSFTSFITPVENDMAPIDNYSNAKQTVVGSFDPNDKQVLEGSQITTSQASDYLHYLVRFQNTGTFYAENIVVRDEMDPNLDMDTFEIVDASHNMRTVVNGNLVEFAFDDIQLPASQDDEPNSHGYILYKAKPVAGFGLGQSVYNTANIYFDYNFPIVTNTVETTVVELGTPDFSRDTAVLYPNPAKDEFSVSAQNAIEKIGIYSLSGQLLFEQKPQSGNSANVKIGGLASGTYLVRIEGEDFLSTKKLLVN